MPEYGSFTDSRDGNIYKTIKIGTQVWMAENLCYNGNKSFIIDDDPDYLKKYGRLYTYENFDVAPKGWRIPTVNDIRILLKNTKKIDEDFTRFRALGCCCSKNFDEKLSGDLYRCYNFDECEYYDDGLEKLGFSKYPAAGFAEFPGKMEWPSLRYKVDYSKREFLFVDKISSFWVKKDNDLFVLQLDEYGAVFFESHNSTDFAYSVRCIKK